MKNKIVLFLSGQLSIWMREHRLHCLKSRMNHLSHRLDSMDFHSSGAADRAFEIAMEMIEIRTEIGLL